MSTRIMALCWPLQMPPSPKAVLISLADNANDHGECWPSLTLISERTCLGRTTVIEAIKWLEAAGIVLADRTNGRHSRYAIDLSRIGQGALFGNEPVRQADQSGSRTGTPRGRDQSGSRTGPVRQPDSNHQEPSRTEKQKQPQAALRDPPEWIDRDAWDGFVEMRKRIRFPLTQRAADLVVRELQKYRDRSDPNDVLDQSTRNGWRDVFPLRQAADARAGPGAARQQDSKTLTGMKAIQGMKNGLVHARDHRRADEAALALVGPDTRVGRGGDHGRDVD